MNDVLRGSKTSARTRLRFKTAPSGDWTLPWRSGAPSKAARGALCVAGAMALAGCGGNPVAGLFGMGQSGPEKIQPTGLKCPVVIVQDGASELRIEANGAVRYQISIANVARDCAPESAGGLGVRVGVEGRVLIGPAGAAGSYFGPLRITVRDDANNRTVGTKSYSVGANVPTGVGQAPFQLVSDPVLVPITPENGPEAFTILVGLGDGKAKAGASGLAPDRTRAKTPDHAQTRHRRGHSDADANK